MRPISLTLKGFRGIRDGLGRDVIELDFEQLAGDAQLVAIVGRNGRGKTTIMDNMTPFPIMPSRAGADGLGGFSYYDQVCLPESIKDLVWEHGGERYRSQLVFRLNGKKKTEAFLHVRQGDTWQPMRLGDGTVSDGKVDTYVQCIEPILGSAETFFTSVFAAQGRRQLSAYKNAEIKTLLADQTRQLGAKASETAKLLKAGLNTVRQRRQGCRRKPTMSRARLANSAIRGNGSTLHGRRKHRARTRLTPRKRRWPRYWRTGTRQCRPRHGAASFKKSGHPYDGGKAALASLDGQDQREADRLAALDRRVTQRALALEKKRGTLMEQRTKLNEVIRQGTNIQRAARRLPLAEQAASARESHLLARRCDVEQWNELAANDKLARTKIAAIEREAGQAALKAQELARRFGLTAEVPCTGTDLQGQCKLLGDAREAKRLQPFADMQVVRLEEERSKLAAHLAEIQRQAAHLAGAHAKLSMAEGKLRCAKARASSLALQAARRGELLQGTER